MIIPSLLSTSFVFVIDTWFLFESCYFSLIPLFSSSFIHFFSFFLNPIMSDDGLGPPIDHGEEVIRSSPTVVEYPNFSAVPEASVSANSESPAVSPTGPVSPDYCITGTPDAMTDVVITTELDTNPDSTCVSDLNKSKPGTTMVMIRSQSLEMETNSDVDIENTNNEGDAAAAPDREGPRVIGGVEWPAPRAFDSIGNDDYRTISTMPSFSCRAIISANFERLEDYAWDGQFFGLMMQLASAVECGGMYLPQIPGI